MNYVLEKAFIEELIFEGVPLTIKAAPNQWIVYTSIYKEAILPILANMVMNSLIDWDYTYKFKVLAKIVTSHLLHV